MRISHVVTYAWCLLSCHCVPLRRIWIQLYTWVVSLAASKTPHIVHPQTNYSLSKTLSEDDQVPPCCHPHSWFAVFFHPSLEPHSLHYLDQWMSSTLKLSLCLFLKKPGNQQCSTIRQAFLKKLHTTSHLGSRIWSSSSQKAQAKLD